MNALYQGVVHHARPGKHKLRYRIFMLTLDLDAPPRGLKLLAHNRFRLFSFYDRDHADRVDAPLRPQIEARLRAAGIAWDGGRIVLLTMPRMLNYVFNPISLYFCYRRDGAIAAIVHQVSNTFGERSFYVLPATRIEDGVILQRCAKDFFVSPFLEMDLGYEFCVTPPGETAGVSMIVRRGDTVALTASFQGARRPLTDAHLLRAFAANPLMTLMVIAGIHWEALKMLAKGVRFLGRRGSSSMEELSARLVRRSPEGEGGSAD